MAQASKLGFLRRVVPSTRRWRIVWLVLLVLFVSSCLASRNISRRAVFPANQSSIEMAPASNRSTTEVIAYRTSDGIDLRGALVRPRDPRPGAPTIVFFHGNGESAAGEVPLAQQLAMQLGVDVFVGEYRGYGGCPGSPSESGLFEDGRAAVLATKKSDSDLIISGWSLGTAVAVELASEGHGRAVVLLSPFTSIVDAARGMAENPEQIEAMQSFAGSFGMFVKPLARVVDSPLAGLVIADHFDSLSRIGKIQSPVFVVHGTHDSVVPYALGVQMANAARRGELLTADGVDHPVQYTPEAMRAFRTAVEFSP